MLPVGLSVGGLLPVTDREEDGVIAIDDAVEVEVSQADLVDEATS